MNTAGDAAEQVVKMTLQGVEVAARITGTAAKEIALLIIAALKSDGRSRTKLKGKERLASMLKSGKSLELYSVKESDLKIFSKAAKGYGIVYCVLKNAINNPDGLCDILVKTEDAPKLARIIDRYGITTVDRGQINKNSADERDVSATPEKSTSARIDTPEIMDQSKTDELLDDLFGSVAPEKSSKEQPSPDAEHTDAKSTTTSSNKNTPERDGAPQKDPFTGKGKDNQSEPTLKHSSNSAKGSLNNFAKPSVRQEIRDIKQSRKEAEKAALEVPAIAEKPKLEKPVMHMQPRQKDKLIKTHKGAR